jgi:hypothetical protein
MWTLLKPVFLSILIIALLHYLVNYFKDTYTTKKTKDVIGFHVQKYKDILDQYQETQKINESATPVPSESPTHFLSEQEKMAMSNDLQQFLQEQITNTI